MFFNKVLCHPSGFDRLYCHFQRAINSRRNTSTTSLNIILYAKLKTLYTKFRFGNQGDFWPKLQIMKMNKQSIIKIIFYFIIANIILIFVYVFLSQSQRRYFFVQNHFLLFLI